MAMTQRADGAAVGIRQMVQEARRELALSMGFVRARAERMTVGAVQGCRWHLFSDAPNPALETCAIACGITVLTVCGESPDSELLLQAKNSLLYLQQTDSGGWTSWISDRTGRAQSEQEEPLVLDTFYALRALWLLGASGSPEFQRGLEWLRRAHDPATRAWGFYRGGDASTLATAYAVTMLSGGYAQSMPVARDVRDGGVEWLLKLQRENGDGGWGRIKGAPSSAVHTALTLRALVDSGFDLHSQPIREGRAWLLENSGDTAETIDAYYTPGRTASGKRTGTRDIVHVNFPEGIVLQGLVAAGAELLDPQLVAALRRLLDQQDRSGYFKCLSAHHKQPIYAIMDGCLALAAFVERVEERQAVLEVYERIKAQDQVVAELAARLEELAEQGTRHAAGASEVRTAVGASVERLGVVEAELGRLARAGDEVSEVLRDLQSGLAVLQPLMAMTRAVRKYPMLSLLVAVSVLGIVGSAYGVTSTPRLEPLYLGGTLVITTAAFFLAVISYVRQVRSRD